MGRPLLSHMRAAGRISVAMGLRFVKQICRAMALVHGQGAVHRDLKSDNILIDRRGVVRVVDFGLAAFADRRLGFVPGAMGTFTYMAPETLHGRSTPASDIYSLGLLMYELFTGGGPHLSAAGPPTTRATTATSTTASSRRCTSPPSEVQNEIRNDYRWLDALILRCLETEPERRFADAGELLTAIEACQAGGEPPEPSAEASVGSPHEPDPPQRADEETDRLFREVRKLLARKQFEQAVDRLDVHRPAEWAVLDQTGARTLRMLGQAYVGSGNLAAGRECLDQLREVQRRQPLLNDMDYIAALSDLYRCYRGLKLEDLANACRQEGAQLSLVFLTKNREPPVSDGVFGRILHAGKPRGSI